MTVTFFDIFFPIIVFIAFICMIISGIKNVKKK